MRFRPRIRARPYARCWAASADALKSFHEEILIAVAISRVERMSLQIKPNCSRHVVMVAIKQSIRGIARVEDDNCDDKCETLFLANLRVIIIIYRENYNYSLERMYCRKFSSRNTTQMHKKNFSPRNKNGNFKAFNFFEATCKDTWEIWIIL